jgi:hypothetical protein
VRLLCDNSKMILSVPIFEPVEANMSRVAIFSLGGLGGLLPVLASLLAVDLASVIDHANTLTLGNYLGYGIRVAVLILLGGIMALLNDEVRQPLTLVQLGIAAPALITAYINGAALTPNNPQQHPRVALPITFVAPAKADEADSHRSTVVVGGFLSDVFKGVTLPLPKIEDLNKQIGTPQVSPSPRIPPSVYPDVPAPQSGMGVYCTTPAGRFGPGPTKPLGSPCVVNSAEGELNGRVTGAE